MPIVTVAAKSFSSDNYRFKQHSHRWQKDKSICRKSYMGKYVLVLLKLSPVD